MPHKSTTFYAAWELREAKTIKPILIYRGLSRILSEKDTVQFPHLRVRVVGWAGSSNTTSEPTGRVERYLWDHVYVLVN